MRNTVLSPIPIACATCVAFSATTSTGAASGRFRNSVALAHPAENQSDEQANKRPCDERCDHSSHRRHGPKW